MASEVEYARLNKKTGDWEVRLEDGSKVYLSDKAVKKRIALREKFTEEHLPEWTIEAKVIRLAKLLTVF